MLEQQEVRITKEDVNAIQVFCKHFNIPVPSYLQAQLDNFTRKSPKGQFTYDDEVLLKIAVAKFVTESTHPLISDELFTEAKENCTKEWFDAQFTTDLETALKE